MPRPRRRSSRGRRPTYLWTHSVSDPATVTAGGQASLDVLQNVRSVAPEAISRGNSIRRVLGSLYVRPGDASSETEGVVGLTYTEGDAEAASAVADPVSDTLARWLWWKRFILGTQATGELGLGDYKEFEFDLKMNLKLTDRTGALNFILENDDGTHTFTFAMGVRILIQRG